VEKARQQIRNAIRVSARDSAGSCIEEIEKIEEIEEIEQIGIDEIEIEDCGIEDRGIEEIGIEEIGIEEARSDKLRRPGPSAAARAARLGAAGSAARRGALSPVGAPLHEERGICRRRETP
jgi:hypothetical protein